MKKLKLVALVLLSLKIQAQQNLVPNGSFEEITQCPETTSQVSLAVPWSNTEGGGSPDLYNICSEPDFYPPDWYVYRQGVPENGAGYQYAHSGDGYAGIFTYGGQYETNGREYLQVPLSEPLQSGGYVISFWASLADEFQYAMGSLGAYLSDTLIIHEQFNSVLEVEPSIQSPAGIIMSDKDIWYHITDTFSSRFGGEQYLLIGNFKSTAESDTLLVPTGANNRFQSYYYIDDVSVVALDSVPSGVEEVGQGRSNFSVYPNPNNGRMMVGYELNEGESGKLFIYTAMGELVLQRVLTTESNLMEINVLGISSGMYLLDIQINGEHRFTERLSILKE